VDEPGSQQAFEWMRARLWDDESILLRLVQASHTGQPVVMGFVPYWEDGQLGFVRWNDAEGIYEINFHHPPKGPVLRASYLVSNGEGKWSGTRWPDTASEVGKYLSEPKAQDIWCRPCGVLPVRMSVVRNWPEIIKEGAPCSETANHHVPSRPSRWATAAMMSASSASLRRRRSSTRDWRRFSSSATRQPAAWLTCVLK
jgi:hypothetical protein